MCFFHKKKKLTERFIGSCTGTPGKNEGWCMVMVGVGGGGFECVCFLRNPTTCSTLISGYINYLHLERSREKRCCATLAVRESGATWHFCAGSLFYTPRLLKRLLLTLASNLRPNLLQKGRRSNVVTQQPPTATLFRCLSTDDKLKTECH